MCNINLISDTVQILLKFNNRQTRSYKQLRKSWKKILRNMKKGYFIITFKTKTLWLLINHTIIWNIFKLIIKEIVSFLFIIQLLQMLCI